MQIPYLFLLIKILFSQRGKRILVGKIPPEKGPKIQSTFMVRHLKVVRNAMAAKRIRLA